MSLLPMILSLAVIGSEAQSPDAVARELYAYVVAHKPLGIPAGEDRRAIWPLLSARLKQQLDAARACEDDYRRQHPDLDEKPSFVWLEAGLFSGSEEEALPSEVAVESVASHGGRMFHVTLRFTYRESFATYGRPPDPKNVFHWRGAAVVISEGGRFLIDDVLLFEDGTDKVRSRLSEMFVGCEGPHWVGGGV